MKAAMGALALPLFIATGSAGHAQDATGTWLVEDKDGIVQIGPCGGGLCGKVIWIRDPIDKATGRPPVDEKNADPALRTRPIMGLQVLSNLQPSSTAKRWDGRVYNIDDGKTYTARVTLLGSTQLRVEGCVLMVCRGETWTRQAPPAR